MKLRKHSWIVFVVIGVLFFFFALYNLFYIPALDPADPDEGWLWLTSDPDVIDYIKFSFRVQGVWQIPLALFVVFTAISGLRRGQRWAWYSFWYIPIHFLALGVLMPWIIPVLAPLLILAVAALVLTIPLVFGQGHEAA